MAWLLYIILGLAGLLAAAIFIGGYVGFKQALMRPTKPTIALQPPDPNAQLQAEKRNGGKEYLFAHNPEDVSLTARDGKQLKGWFLPAERPTNNLVVVAHGIHSTGPDEYGAYVKFFHEEMGYHMLLPDHRAHGRSPGKYIGFSGVEWQDMYDWADAFVQRLGPDTKVAFQGTSMGGAIVMNCNAHNPPDYVKCVVEDCGYTNGYEMITLAAARDLNLKFPPVFWACALWYRIFNGVSLRRGCDPYGQIAKFSKPTLFVHGAADTFIPSEMCTRCYEAATVPKDLLLVEGAGHALSYCVGKDEYEAKLRKFLGKYMEERSNVKIGA